MFIKLSLIGYRYSPLMYAAVEQEEVLRNLQGFATQANEKKKAEEKAAIYAEVKAIPGVELKAELWRLMEALPDLNGDRGELGRLINWFRAPALLAGWAVGFFGGTALA